MDSLPCTLMIPAAGDSMRFAAKTGVPKGLIRFMWHDRHQTMIEHIVPRSWGGDVRVGVKIRDVDEFKRRLPSHYIVQGMPPTSGQAETVRNMAFFAQPGLDVLVVNSDNAFENGILEEFLDYCRTLDACAGAITFRPKADFERYGYVDAHPNFKMGAEKMAISKYALAGAFYFRSPNLIIRYASMLSHYISEWFLDVPKPKVSFEIDRARFQEWGTANLLEESVGRIEWEVV